MKKILTVILAISLFAIFGCVAFAAEADVTAKNENLFDTLYAWASANAAEIFSVLAFSGSVLVGFTYKRGLVPVLNASLTKIKACVDESKDKTDALLKEIGEKFDTVAEKSENSEQISMALKDEMAALEARVGELYSDVNERERLKAVILAQVDMLYEVFMNSSLPQYAKDNVGERVLTMKREISEGEAI